MQHSVRSKSSLKADLPALIIVGVLLAGIALAVFHVALHKIDVRVCNGAPKSQFEPKNPANVNHCEDVKGVVPGGEL